MQYVSKNISAWSYISEKFLQVNWIKTKKNKIMNFAIYKYFSL